jgi:hypothetical protein
MKYVNINIQCFNKKPFYAFSNTGFSQMIDSIKAKEDNGKYAISGFNIAVFINIRGTQNDGNENPINEKSILNFKIRLTKLDKDKDKQLSYDLKEFSIDLSDTQKLKHGCFDYYVGVENIFVDELILESCGSYVIKALVKKQNQEKYDVQIIHPLDVIK